MAKRSIEAYSPVEFLRNHGRRTVSDDQIDALVRCAGPLPKHTFDVSSFERDGDLSDVRLSARERVHYGVELAASTYDWDLQQGVKPTPTQLLESFGTIETAARKLLLALGAEASGKGVEGMPHALRYGGLAAHAKVGAKRGQTEEAERSGDELLRDAIEGVRDINRWACAARERQERIKDQRPVSADRNEGDEALNHYLRTVVYDCWWQVWGREIKDNLDLSKFIREAAHIVGVQLTEATARRRLRVNFPTKGTDEPQEK